MGLEAMSDQIHIVEFGQPRVSPAEIARLMGGESSRRLMQGHPE